MCRQHTWVCLVHGDPGMVVKAPVLCQAHAEPVVKPLQKQDVEMKLKMLLECVGCGGDSEEQRLSSACFTLGAACTPRGLGGLEAAAAPRPRWKAQQGPSPAAGRPATLLCSACHVQAMPCLQFNVSLLAVRPRAKERPLYLRTDLCWSILSVCCLHLNCLV